MLAAPQDGQELINVLWEQRELEMFAVDVDIRGTEIKDTETEPGHSRKTAMG